MIKKFGYSPPVFHLVPALFVALVSGMVIRWSGYGGFPLYVGLWALICFVPAVIAMFLFFIKVCFGYIKMGDDFIVIGRPWRRSVKIVVKDISKVTEINTYDNGMEMVYGNKTYLIKRNHLSKKNFDVLKDILLKNVGQKV